MHRAQIHCADQHPHCCACAGHAWDRDMMAKMHDRFGGVDILVNNAGIQFVAPVHEFPEDKVRHPLTGTSAITFAKAIRGLNTAFAAKQSPVLLLPLSLQKWYLHATKAKRKPGQSTNAACGIHQGHMLYCSQLL